MTQAAGTETAAATGLRAWFDGMRAWLDAHGGATWWVVGTSLVMLVGSLLIVRVVLVRMPADYFCRHDQPAARRHPVLHVLFVVGRNLAGVILLALGLLMVIGPGQGLITILIAIGLLDFPGKRRLELALVRRRPIHRAIDWVRKRAGRAPLVLPAPPTSPPPG